MPILEKPQYEKFAFAIYSGQRQQEAAITAGYAPTAAALTGHRLIHKDIILARIAELHEGSEKPTIMSRERILERLSEIGEAKLVDFLQDGEPKLDGDTPNASAASEYYIREGFDRQGSPVVRKSIKLHSPITAMAEISKMRGDYAPQRVDLDGTGKLGDVLSGLLSRLRGYTPNELDDPSNGHPVLSEGIPGDEQEGENDVGKEID